MPLAQRQPVALLLSLVCRSMQSAEGAAPRYTLAEGRISRSALL